jgi:hypothetical protein
MICKYQKAPRDNSRGASYFTASFAELSERYHLRTFKLRRQAGRRDTFFCGSVGGQNGKSRQEFRRRWRQAE